MDVTDLEPLAAVSCPVCGAPTVIAATIDHFDLVDVIGHGGMGAVYKAHDTSLDRFVALKLLRKSSGSAEQITQLETEASITASINHPHVVRVFSTGLDHGRFYIAMELVEKGTLDKLIELQGRVAEAQVLEVGIQIASGLRAAQNAGLIHRDVKPGNILFADAHTAKIVDFGLAIFAEDEAKVRGEVWGTPYYVAPEKLDNKPEDFRSDIYSLGGTLFHALAGRPPFEAENASMVALKHLKSQAVSLQAFAPHVSSNTTYVINRTLNKDPEQRYQSYDELIEHLEYARTELLAAGGKPQQAKRVVLETAADTKAMGWVVTGMIGVMIALGVAAFFFRDRLFPNKEEPAATASDPANPNAVKAGTMFPEALAKFQENHPAEAAEILAKIAAQRPAQPRLDWANMLEGLAELAAGHRPDSVATFTKIEERGPFSNKDSDQKLAAFFVEVAHQMASEQPVDVAAGKSLSQVNYEALALLLYGMKNWELGKIDEGVELLRLFRQATPAGQDAWIADLKPVGMAYLDEFTSFEMASDRLKKAQTIPDKKGAVQALKDIKGKLARRAEELALKGVADVAAAEKARAQMWAEGKVPDGRYKLVNRKSGKAIEVEGRSKDDGHKVQQSGYKGQPNAQWNVTTLGDGYYLIVGVDSNKALNVPKEATDDGVALQQANVNKGASQRWKIEKVEGNFFKLTAAGSGKALAIGDSQADGGPIVQTSYTNAPEQQWKFEAP
jgi:hypothetical protein